MNITTPSQASHRDAEAQKKQLALMLMLTRHAIQHGLPAAQQLARKYHTRLSKEQAMRCIEMIEGEEAARQQGQLWEDAFAQSLDARIQHIIQTETAALRQQHQAQQRWRDMLAGAAATIRQIPYAVQDLLNGLLPPAPAALVAVRGDRDDAAASPSRQPILQPSMDLDGQTLYITLRLQQPAHGGESPPHYSMPDSAEAILLCIHGETVTDFEYEHSPQHITLAVPLTADMAEQIKQQELHLRYHADLQQIGVWIGAAPEEAEA